MKSKLQNTAAHNMLDPKLIVAVILSVKDWEEWKLIYDIRSPFKV
jgi:hypothetical protein